ncbi:carbonic anhydrase-related protein 10-like [Liolophura sinensis]|uniref:carbonic anhydrase-related protein 10-like n=1 Tax=Liolophura sinensis TaxID=3198878 RepID=UPI0031583F2C
MTIFLYRDIARSLQDTLVFGMFLCHTNVLVTANGPAYWGRLNTEWRLCNDGKLQSPIDIDPKHLLFDPTLKKLSIEGYQINGLLVNSGNDLSIDVDDDGPLGMAFYSGPVCYRYKVKYIKIHFGINDYTGSEHRIAGNEFPAEIQLLAYNAELYGNYTQAEMNAHGLMNVAVFAELGNISNRFLESFKVPLEKVRFKGEEVRVNHLPLGKLMPQTKHYVTYEGSQTQPGCHETVTWVIMNRPVYITKDLLHDLRQLNQGGRENPIMLMKNNKRPLMPVRRLLDGAFCITPMT